ncbi:putative regulatory protein [Patulibacter medicamentivorans]|uniref:Putative regulatory protein n=1 Tax=Patulibacter medicamentivorans TaxID=1097667 RepID=H0EAI7_9ACTN|nr:LuxR family transcriptional regulator [Patulibacter medicamentivorans]EHN09314.1 putative regulatory protein [Patulibacter medicamentivorans]
MGQQGEDGGRPASWGPGRLLERERELAALDAANRAATGGAGGALVVLRGPSGIGRSSLLTAYRHQAEAAGMVVASTVGVPTRTAVGYAAARELIAAVDARAQRAPSSARAVAAWRVLTGAAAPEEAPPTVMLGEGAQVVARGLTEYVLEVADHRPLALVVDDLQAVDEPTQRWLALLAHRIDRRALVLVVALHEGHAEQRTAPIAELCGRAGARLLDLGPLSERATRSIVASGLRSPASDGLARHCHELTGGNPFLTIEIVAELRTRRQQGTDAGLALLEGGLDRFVAHILTRAESVGPEAAAVAEAVAVLGPGARIDDLAALAGIGVDEVAHALDGLGHVGLLSAADGGFRHPILRSALYDAIGLRQRQALHELAARRFVARAEPAREAAAHVLATRPGRAPWARDVLIRAGHDDLLAGAPETAVRYLRRALDEGIDRDDEAVLHALLAMAHWQTGDAVRASAEMERAIAGAQDEETRLRWAIERNTMMTSHADTIDAALPAFERVHAASVAHVSPDTALVAESCLLADQLLLRPGAVDPAVDRHRDLEGRTDGEQQLLSILAWRAFVAGEPRDVVISLARRGLGHGHGPIESFLVRNSGYYASFALLLADDRPFISEALAAWEDAARDLNALFGTSGLLMLRSYDALVEGDFAVAAERAGEALELTGPLASLGFMALACRVRALLELDLVVQARTELDQAGVAFPLPPTALTNPLLHARGLVERAEGRRDDAWATFHEVGRADAEAGIAFSPASPWRTEAARIAIERGDDDAARELADAHHAAAESWGAPGERARAAAEARLAGLPVAPPALDPATTPYLRATVEHALGLAALWAGDADRARHHLRAARDGLELARHPRRVRLVEDALREAGGRRSARDDDPLGLTPAERRIVDLVVAGLSNREVAERLVVRPKSVENQLGRIYRRLGVRSRTELERALRDGERSGPA